LGAACSVFQDEARLRRRIVKKASTPAADRKNDGSGVSLATEFDGRF
jgi:hypothetical protein